MTSVFYISPSVLPSRTANSVHVVHQCAGFADTGAEVTLVAKRAGEDARDLPAAVEEAYGIDAGALRFESVFSRSSRGDTLRIALLALRSLARRERPPDLILSRNLYAAYALAVLRGRPIVFETHQLEIGPRKALQRAIMTRPRVTTVMISEKLKEFLSDHHGAAPSRPLVLHDAAPAGIRPLKEAEKPAVLASLLPDRELSGRRAVCGYFGHLYPGRGIEIIEAMARSRPDVLFLVFGGNEGDIAARRAAVTLNNMIFTGFVPHAAAQRAMAACDVLLMPYQASVSIGLKGHDTARWMSPMKMFEYLASGTPIVSSDMPVLREVLTDGQTALLARPDDPEAWVACLDRLLAEPELARAIGAAGHRFYAEAHSWTRRAEAIIEATGLGVAKTR